MVDLLDIAARDSAREKVGESLSVRFMAVATLQRGALEVPEPLDDANQWRAFSAMRADESRAERVKFELGECVLWEWNPVKAGVA